MYTEVKTFHGTISGEVVEGSLLGTSTVKTSSGEIYERWIDGNYYQK